MKASKRGHPTTISSQEWRWTAIWAVVGVILTSLPYLLVFLTTPSELVYTGFLTNPEDGHTYLAKIRQGERGQWRFTLPYTAEPHQGAFLYTYYLALGHLARGLGVGPLALWHTARAANGFALLLVLYYTVAHWFHDIAQRRFAFSITALGSGLGWLVLLFGKTTVDLWVPEGYVWYSLFINPHFPLAIALMLLALVWSVTPWGARRARPWRLVGVGLSALALGLVQPLGLLNIGVALAAYSVVLWVQKRRPPWRELCSGAALALGGGPFVLNAYLAFTRNPTMALWTAQNQTPSPPLWDYALGYGLVLLLAVAGLWAALRRKRDSDWLLVAWAATTGVLIYLPLGLQRRLVIAWIVPLGLLATRGWDTLRRRGRTVPPAVIAAFSALTPLFLVSIALTGAFSRHPALFVGQDEKAALDWLAGHTREDVLVIAAPDTGLYIPAWSGRRVWYGHRFETARAVERRAQLEAFYRDNDRGLLDQRPPLRARYVWFGPREQALSRGHWQPDPGWQVAFSRGTVTLYAVPQE